MMTVLEGVGDEVVVCLICLLLLLLTYVAWIVISFSVSQEQVPPVTTSSNVNDNHVEEQRSFIDEVESNVDPQVEVDVPQNADDPEDTRKKRLDFFDNPSNGTASATCNGFATTIPESSSTESDDSQDVFQIRLKYLDDSERVVSAQPTDRIDEFKRSHFGAELANNKIIRLIYHGQVLQDQGTLTSYGLTNGCCIHVQVVGSLPGQTPGNQGGNESELDLSQFLWPLLGVFLGVLWMLHFQYREYFSTSSTVALFGLSGLFLTIVWNQYTSSQPVQTGR